jgi:hypothetical protein
VASNWGLLARVFFLAEGFCGEAFLFCRVVVSVGGSFGGVSFPYPLFSPSSPPPYPSTSSPPPPPREIDPFPSEALFSSSVYSSWNSSFFFFFFALVCPTCLTRVTKGIPMMSASEIYTSATSTRNSSNHSLVICSMSSSIIL